MLISQNNKDIEYSGLDSGRIECTNLSCDVTSVLCSNFQMSQRLNIKE